MLQDFSGLDYRNKRLNPEQSSRNHIWDLVGVRDRSTAQRHMKESSKPGKDNVIETKVTECNEAWLKRSPVGGFVDLDVHLDRSLD